MNKCQIIRNITKKTSLWHFVKKSVVCSMWLFFISQRDTEGSQRTTEKVIIFNSVVLCAVLCGSLCNIFALYCRNVHFKINQVKIIVSGLFIKIDSSELSIFVNILFADEKDIFC